MLPHSDKDLLARVKEFDLKALETVYNTYSPRIYRYAMRLLGDSAIAEDCVAETFSRFLKALRFNQGPDDHMQAYLYRIAHNWITDFYRRKPFTPIELDEDIPEGSSSFTEDHLEVNLKQEKVRRALMSLTPDQRQVTILHYFEDWNYEKIGKAMNKAEGTVRALQFRAIHTLRSILQMDQEDDKYD